MYSASCICVRFPFNYLEKKRFESFGIYLLPHLHLAIIEKQLASGFAHLYKIIPHPPPVLFFIFMDFAVVAGVVEYVRVFNQKEIIEQLRDIL